MAWLFLIANLWFPEDADPHRFEIDPTHYFISFTVRHFSVGMVRAGFNKVTGGMRYDENDLSRFELKITVDAASIYTNHKERDVGLASPYWLDAAKFPEITFVSKSLVKEGEGFRVTGDFTMKGITQEISFPVAINGPAADPLGLTRVGFLANFTVNRQDYGMPFDRLMKDGGPFVGNELHVEVLIEAIR